MERRGGAQETTVGGRWPWAAGRRGSGLLAATWSRAAGARVAAADRKGAAAAAEWRTAAPADLHVVPAKDIVIRALKKLDRA